MKQFHFPNLFLGNSIKVLLFWFFLLLLFFNGNKVILFEIAKANNEMMS